MNRPVRQTLFTLLLSCGFCVACGSSHQHQEGGVAAPGAEVKTISVSGTARFADGTTIEGRNAQYQLVLDGANMFQAGVNGCLPTPAHVAGTTIQNAPTTHQGAYTVSTSVSALQAAVRRQCTIQSLHSSQVEGLILRASILADEASCASYCSAGGSPSAECVKDCATGNRTIIASASLDSNQFNTLLNSSGNGEVHWTTDLSYSAIGPALTTGPGPDLQVDEKAAETSAHVSTETFSADSCEVSEQCVRAAGVRTVLRFDGTILNLGSDDLVIGSPANSGLFQKSSCHNVELLKNIMIYELIDPDTGEVVKVGDQDVVSRKQGFCMMDIVQANASSPQGRYDCDNQGITAGWGDLYDAALDCQFVDVTGVPQGAYTLRLTVNPDGLFSESDPSNNSVDVPVTIPAAVPQGAL